MTGAPIRTILFVGKPGSGKETQARLLVEKTGFHLMSTGEKFRELREHRDSLGQHVKTEYDAGRLMPDWFADYLFEDTALHLPIESGIIFEGSGRSRKQADLVDIVCTWLGRTYVVIHLSITDEEAMKRQLGRGRPDSDTASKIQTRLEEYARVTMPALDYYTQKGVLITIDGVGSIEDIYAMVLKHLGIS